MAKKIIELERKLRSNSANERYLAALELAGLGIQAVPILSKALKDDRKEVYEEATTGIIVLMNESEDIDKEKLLTLLKPATECLINIVEGAKVSRGVHSYSKYVTLAINTLKAIGDPIALPVLEKILAKVKNKLVKQGIVYKYVQTKSIAGYISTDDDIYHIQSAIKAIKNSRKK
ncbi:MAG: hypothetical protein AMJ92_00565 [candidate division Zixibacteria bacterium SM23_81]|nr:MAG: hypothetical protein AMJ92_00565 [candidate division Zixibacteria bacterium SM23_81]